MPARVKEAESYASPAIQARRERILVETRKLITEQGLPGFSLSELCRRADVAKQTIYYAFDSKEGLIAAALLDYFEQSEQQIHYRCRVGSLERIIERIVAISQRNVGIRNYVGAITAFYYSMTTSLELSQAFQTIISAPHRPYIAKLRAARQLQPWVDSEQLSEGLNDQRMSVVSAWVQGRISDDRFTDRMALAVLTYLLGSVRGRARSHVEEVLKQVTAKGGVAFVAGLPAT
jgi:AcrR family transcriptional regulator